MTDAASAPSNGVPAATGTVADGRPDLSDAATCPLSAPWALAIDVVMILSILVLRVALLSFVVRLISRHTADLSLRKSALVALTMTALYASMCGSLDPKTVGLALSVTVFVGFLICKRLFWIGFERSLYACIIYAVISAALSDLPTMQVDRLLPGRATVDGALAAVVDAHARRKAEDVTLPPSPTLRAALTRVSTSTNESAFVAMVLGPLRTEQKLRAKIADINKAATENARQVNELSGAGTNVGTRASEAAKLRESMGVARKEGKQSGAGILVPGGIKKAIGSIGNMAGDEAAVVDSLSGQDAGGPSPVDAAPPAAPDVPPPAPVEAKSTVVATNPPAAVAKFLGELQQAVGLGASTQAVPVAVAPAPVVPPPAEAAPTAPVPAPVAQGAESIPSPVPVAQATPLAAEAPVAVAPVAPPPAPVNADPLAALSAADRTAWTFSKTGLVVNAVMRHGGDRRMAMVNHSLVHVGETVTVTMDGRTFEWRLLDATEYAVRWEPVVPVVPVKPAAAPTGAARRR